MYFQHILIAFVCIAELFVLNCIAKDIKTKCSEADMRKYDQVSARIISFSVNQRKYPETRQQMAPFCK